MAPKRSIVDCLTEHARRAPGSAALHDQDRAISYAQLEQACARCRASSGRSASIAWDRLPRTPTGKVRRFKLRELSRRR